MHHINCFSCRAGVRSWSLWATPSTRALPSSIPGTSTYSTPLCTVLHESPSWCLLPIFLICFRYFSYFHRFFLTILGVQWLLFYFAGIFISLYLKFVNICRSIIPDMFADHIGNLTVELVLASAEVRVTYVIRRGNICRTPR